MTTSIRGHKLATLREVCGLTQQELADLVGRSVHTIRSIEQGKHPLGERLATRISRYGFVSADWLLDDEITGPPLDRTGRTLTRRAYELHAGSLARFREKLKSERSPLLNQLMNILEQAEKVADVDLVYYRTAKFLGDLKREFLEGRIHERREELKSAGSSRLSRKTTEKIRQRETAKGLAESFATKPETMTDEELVQAIIDNAQSPMPVEEALRSIKAKPKALEALEDLARAVQAKRRPKPMTFEVLMGAIQGRGEHAPSPFGRRQPQAKDKLE